MNGHAGDTEANRVVPNKIHIRGLDFLDENQLKSYIISHVGGKGADRIEWVNDSSANLVFGSEAAAQDALIQLAAVEIADATQLPPSEILPAKSVVDKPEVALQVRFAVESDRKERNAAQKSRFYLFHPEWDPETDEGRRRRESGRDRKYRDRDDRGGNRRNNGKTRYEDRYRDEEPETFDVSLYDDDAGASAKRITPRRDERVRDSRSPSIHSESDRKRSTNRDKELFPNRKELFPNRRPRDPMRSDRAVSSRDRSRSPGRDDRDAMEYDLARDREAVRNNREKARSLKERISRSDGDSRDSKSKELFPSKVVGEGRRAQMDQVPSDLLAGMKGLSYDGAVDSDITSVPFSAVPGPATSLSDHTDEGPADRIHIRNSSSNLVTLTFTDRITNSRNAMSIRGSAQQSGGSGMLKIKGTSVKELFPNKFNGDSSNSSSTNAGKELFADRVSGGSRRRQKAEDLFY